MKGHAVRPLIIGGTGFIGRRLVARAVQSGAEVVVMTRSGKSQADGSTAMRGDISVRSDVDQAFRQSDPTHVIVLAACGVSGRPSLRDLYEVNVTGVANVLSVVAELAPSTHVLMTGSGFEYGPSAAPLTENNPVAPFTPYGLSKAAGFFTARLWQNELPLTWLRLFGVYGPGEPASRLLPSVLRAAERGDSVRLSACDQLRDFLYVDDAADGIWNCLMTEPKSMQVMNLASGSGVTLKHFVEHFAAILREAGLRVQLDFGALPYRPGEPMTYLADIRRLQGSVGWRPATSMRDGLQKTARGDVYSQR